MNRKYLFYILIGTYIVNLLLDGFLSPSGMLIGSSIIAVLQKYSKEKEFPLYRTIFGLAFSIIFILLALYRIFNPNLM